MSGSAPPPAAVDEPGAPAQVSARRHILRVPLLMAGACLPILGAVLISPVLPKIQAAYATVPGAKALVPLVLTIPALALAVLAPFAGVIVDRLGRKRLLVWSTAAYAVFGTAPLWLKPLAAILVSRVLVGITEAAIMTCCTTLIGDYYTGRQRDRYLALQTMCASASATVFFVLGGAAGSSGWRTPFWIYAVSLLLAPAMAAFLPRPAGTREAQGSRPAQLPFPVGKLWTTCILTAFGAMVFYTVPVELPYLLDHMNVKATGVIGLVTALASAATVTGAVLFARLHRSPDSLLPGVFALCALGFAIMFLAPNPVLMAAGAVVNCVGTGLMLPSLLTRAMSRLDFADRGRGTGLWMAAFFGGEFVCPLVLLALQAAVSTLAAAVGLFAVAAAATAIALALTSRRRSAGVPAAAG